jgi:hypothetical protein
VLHSIHATKETEDVAMPCLPITGNSCTGLILAWQSCVKEGVYIEVRLAPEQLGTALKLW